MKFILQMLILREVFESDQLPKGGKGSQGGKGGKGNQGEEDLRRIILIVYLMTLHLFYVKNWKHCSENKKYSNTWLFF